MMKKLLPVLLSGVFATSALASTTDTLRPDAEKLIDVWLESELDYQDIPYLSASYTQGAKVVWSGVYGVIDKTTSAKANDETISSICSISKVITATAVMKLVDEGKLSLDSKLSTLLPKLTFEKTHASSGDITVKHLLNHTSGVPRDTKHSYWSGPVHNFPSENELYESLATQQTIGEIDQQHAYSNVGYALLGLIITEVTGQSYKEYIENEIFAPIGMSNSVVELPELGVASNHAIGYTAPNRDRNRKVANVYQTRAMQPAAGVSSNAEDLAKFASWQFKELQADSKILISASSLEKMYQTDHSEAAKHRGLGYQISKDKSGDTWAMHGGMCPGYNSFLKINVTDKEAFAFTTSANKVRAIKYINSLSELVSRGKQIKTDKQVTVDLADYEGFYDLNPWNSEYYVGKWGQDLVLLYLPADSMQYAFYQYQHIEKDTFQLVENGELKDEIITFNKNKAGKVVSITNGGNLHFKKD